MKGDAAVRDIQWTSLFPDASGAKPGKDGGGKNPISMLTQTDEPPIVLLGGTYSAARDSYASLQVKGTPGLLLNARAVQIELQGHPVFEFPRLWSVLLDVVIGCSPLMVFWFLSRPDLFDNSSVHTEAVPAAGARPLAHPVTPGRVRRLAPCRANRGESRLVLLSRLVVAQLGAGVVERLCVAVTVRNAARGGIAPERGDVSYAHSPAAVPTATPSTISAALSLVALPVSALFRTDS